MIALKARVLGGKIRLDQPEKMREYAQTMEEGSLVELTVRPWSSGRSLRANAFFHAVLGRYSKENGIQFAKAKVTMKLQFGVWMPIESVQISAPPWRGEFVEYAGDLVFMKSTTDYTQAEFKGLTDGLLAECHDSGVDIDDILANTEI